MVHLQAHQGRACRINGQLYISHLEDPESANAMHEVSAGHLSPCPTSHAPCVSANCRRGEVGYAQHLADLSARASTTGDGRGPSTSGGSRIDAE